MENTEKKKSALLRIMQILNEHSDAQHPLLQEEIADYLLKDYGIDIERKAIGRNLTLLRYAGLDIVSTRKGSFLGKRLLDSSELSLVIDAINSSSRISAEKSREIVARLRSLSSRYFRRCESVYPVNGTQQYDSLLSDIELIDGMIDSGYQISFDYMKYGADKRLHRTAVYTVSPYRIVAEGKLYYLAAYCERYKRLCHFRIDKISNIKQSTLKAVPKNGLSDSELNAIPFESIFSEEPEAISLRAEEWLIDEIIERFGKNVKIEASGKGDCTVSMLSRPSAVLQLALQHADSIEILQPLYLRERMKQTLLEALKSYSEGLSR